IDTHPHIHRQPAGAGIASRRASALQPSSHPSSTRVARVKIVTQLEHDQLTPHGIMVVHDHHPADRDRQNHRRGLRGSIFAQVRHDDPVVAIDADTAFGQLGARVDLYTIGSYWDLAGPPTSTSTPSPTC